MKNNNKLTPESLDISTFDLSKSAMIEASAGTGKTFTISNLVVRLLLGKGLTNPEIDFGEALDIENILIVTFTNAATSDLKARILEKIRSVRKDFEKVKDKGFSCIESIDEPIQSIIRRYVSEHNSRETAASYARLLQRAERSIDNAAISTIHSFCNRALNQIYTFEAGRAFNVELSVKCNEQEKQAKIDVWRELFYKNNDDLDLEALAEALDCKEPGDLEVIGSLENLRLVDSSDGYYGFSVNLGTQDNPDFEEIKISRTDKNSIDERLKKILPFYKKLRTVLIDDVTKEVYECFKEHLKEAVKSDENAVSLYSFYSRKDKKTPKFLNGVVNYFLAVKEKLEAGTENLIFFSTLLKLIKSDSFDPLKQDGTNNTCVIQKKPDFEKFCNSHVIEEFESSFVQILKTCEKKLIASELVAKEIKCLVAIKIMLRADEICQRDNLISSNEVLRQLAVALSGNSDRALNLARQLRSRYPVVMIDEFQDTDPVQFEVFSKLYLSGLGTGQEQKDRSCCYLIGDPKQSIYAFRGSDINSYNKAKDLVLENGGKLYSLDTNYRSTSNLIKGVNSLFEEKENSILPHPFNYSGNKERAPIDSHIRFKEVKAPENADKKAFYFKQDSMKPISNYYVPVSTENSKAPTLESVARATADAVVKCLCYGVIRENGVERKVVPSDIAILVNSRTEFSYIDKALRERNIRSVYFSDHDSVLANKIKQKGDYYTIKPTAEAVNIVYFMEALCQLSQIKNVYRLLGSSLLRLNRAEYDELINGKKIDDEISTLKECLGKWEEFGFFSAFSHYVVQHGLIKKLLKSENGERALTNYFQIAEIIQSVNSKVMGAQAQLLWFKECLKTENQSNLSEDDTKKRLESEQSLVKVLTTFMSKGLQFPVVLLPYMYKDEPKMDSIYYDQNLKHLVYTADKKVQVKNGDLTVSAETLIESARWQERMRLLYVAVTRAQLANFIIRPERDKKSPLLALLSRGDGEDGSVVSDSSLYRNFSEINFEDTPQRYLPPKEEMNTDRYSVSSLQKDEIDRGFKVSSYSEIASGGHNDIFKPGEDEPFSPLETISDPVPDLGAFAKVKGTRIGTFMHRVLELLLSRNIRENHDVDSLYEFAQETFKNDIYGIFNNTENNYCHDLAVWLYEIINAKLPVEISENSYASLSSLSPKDCARELDYYLPCRKFDIDKFNRICQRFYKDVLLSFKIEAKQELAPLSKEDFSGFLTGSLDLVAKFNQKGQDKYYLIDYKTNYLGHSQSDYSKAEVIKSIFTSRYDVQILLYSVALKRFLKVNNILDKNADALGGVMYLYLRGMSAGETLSDGVVLICPDPALIDELDKMLNDELEA